MNTAMIGETESGILDDLTKVNAMILAALHGETLTLALAGECKRYICNDAQLRDRALCIIHPQDLYAALVRGGHTLASVGVVEVR